MFFLFTFSSCSTFSEFLSEDDEPYNYKKTTDQKGRVVYKRRRVIKPKKIEEPRANIQVSGVVKDSTPSKERSYKVVFDIAQGKDLLHMGGGLAFNLSEYFRLIGGVSIFDAHKVYAGFDIKGEIYKQIGRVAPYLGVAGFLGDSKKCRLAYDNFQDEYIESCEKTFLKASYLELGIRYDHIGFFIRNYQIEDAGIDISDARFFGFHLNF